MTRVLNGWKNCSIRREHCGEDSALRQEVEEMPRADGGVLDVPVMEQMGGEELQGRMAGRWKLGRRVGEGGLGVVYEAFDDENRAAVKFFRPGPDAGSFRRRDGEARVELEAAKA